MDTAAEGLPGDEAETAAAATGGAEGSGLGAGEGEAAAAMATRTAPSSQRRAKNQFLTPQIRGTKRKAHYNDNDVKKANSTLTEEEKWEREQANLVPLLTGGQLKPYQIQGVKWLISLWKNRRNGILADEMGLGKTAQTIAFLAHLKGNGLHGPYMVIAPVSTLPNWLTELSRLAPSLTGLIYKGSEADRKKQRRKLMSIGINPVDPGFPIIITSYDIAKKDAKQFLARYEWEYVVFDEGHRLKNGLKNEKCELLKELKRIPTKNKLLLTGTPLQNNLEELWSLLNFILPAEFSSYQEFESRFDFSGKGDEEQQEETDDEKKRVRVVSKLDDILRPFLLRRMKEDVEHMLPRKKEIIIYANMTELQKQLDSRLKENTFVVSRSPDIKAQNLGVQRKLNCAHPYLLDAPYNSNSSYPPVDELLKQCGKFKLLDRLLDALMKRKHKVLIFSHWTIVLDLLHYYLYEKGLKFCRIDGSAKMEERKKQIAEFNDLNSSMNVFILSKGAAGLGIDLTCADTCILYDSDLNPQTDLQAMARCHRTGQTRPVHVYRLVTWGSVEEGIIERAFGKLKPEDVVLGKGQFEQDAAKPRDTFDEGDEQGEEDQDPEEEDTMIISDEDLLKVKQGEEDQPDISDEDLLKVMDRGDLAGHPPAAADAAPLLPLKGPGWEVVPASNMLSALPAESPAGLAI